MTESAKAGETKLRARAILDLDGEPKELEFAAISLNTDNPEMLVVALADDQGRTLTLLLPRAEVKSLLSWRTLMSL